jgi:CHASE3 domain sensor protein
MNKRILKLFLFILLLFFVCSGLSEASDNINKETKTNITVKDIKVA